MPSYAWLATNKLDVPLGSKKLALLQKLGVPYTNEQIDDAVTDQQAQAQVVVDDLAKNGVNVAWDSEMVALISYLQRLGRDHGVALKATVAAAPRGAP